MDHVYINYGKENQRGLDEVSVDEMKNISLMVNLLKEVCSQKLKLHFNFLKNTKGSVLITSLAGLGTLLDGKIGTLIKN